MRGIENDSAFVQELAIFMRDIFLYRRQAAGFIEMWFRSIF